MPKSDWKPNEMTWGELARLETVRAFPEKTGSRAIALCTWCLAQDPDMSLDDIESMAERDPDIPRTTADGKKISAHAQRQARQILGLASPGKKRSPARKTKKEPKLSQIEKAILARYQESMDLVTEYTKAATELSDAQQAFEDARSALQEIPREQAQTLADADTHAAEVLASEGVLADPDPPTTALESAPAVWPDKSADSGTADSWPTIPS